MDILVNLNLIDRLRHSLNQHQPLLDSFTKVYLFGSVLSFNRIPNDVDILLVYGELSDRVLNDSEKIRSILFECSGIQVDMTILSQYEFEETKFLDKLRAKYLIIK